jgi:hypothetical protein
MLKWEIPSDKVKPVKTVKYNLNLCMTYSVRNQTTHSSIIWVNDTLIAAIQSFVMKLALAAAIEAIFIVMDEPNTCFRQRPSVMDRWKQLLVAEH